MGKTNGFLSFTNTFPTEQSCIEYYEQIRWNGKYRCANTGKYFDVKTGTVFAHTKLPLRYWFYAMFLLLSHKRGVSSCQLARDLGVTQKTAWGLLHKIREYMDCENDHQLCEEVEIDETFVGGKNKNRHKDKKVEKCQGRSFKDKVHVFGMYQRGGKLVAKVVPDTRAKTLSPILSEFVTTESRVFTNGWEYGDMRSYEQMSVDHRIGFYGTTVVDADGVCVMVCTNGIENAWSHLKRTIFGTYYQISKKHLQRYVDEFTFRFNTRKLGDFERFELYLHYVA